MIKRTITQEKANRVYLSLQFLYIMANTMLLEHDNEIIDTDFKVPHINQFAKRIKSDTQAIIANLKTSGKIVITAKDNEFLDEYSSAVWEIAQFCVGLPLKDLQLVISQIKEVNNGQLHDISGH